MTVSKREDLGSPASSAASAGTGSKALPATVADIQKRADALCAGMVAKVLPEPDVEYAIRSGARPRLVLTWKSADKRKYQEYKFIEGTVEAAFAAGAEFVAQLPTPEQAKMTAFMAALSEAIELGKKADIDGEFVNPLLAMMKRLSRNAITAGA